MKSKIITLVAVLIVLLGAGILVYPIISNLLFQNSQQELIDYYDSQIRELTVEEKSSMLKDCEEYNRGLLDSKVQLTDPFDTDALQLEEHPYVDLLNQNGDGAMGSIEIPAIHCKLVIYHNTNEEALAKGIGHLQGTSLPVGGTGTHCVLSGHTGTADKELFTNLDQLKSGDVFFLHVWGEIFAYQVDQKQVVLPNETDSLYIDRDADRVTLITCTPYGVNSHRLLVRGSRIPYEEAIRLQQANSPILFNTWQRQYLYAIIAGIGISVVVVIVIVLVYRRVNRKKTAAAVKQSPDSEPANSEPADNKPTDNKPTNNEPTDSTPTDNETTDNAPTDNKPTHNKPTDSTPTDSKPTDSKPTNNKPTDSETTHNKPTDNDPTDNKPTDSETTHNEPTDSTPTDSTPTDNDPTHNKPTDNEPTNSEPTNSEPTDSEPTDNEPTDNEPTDSKPTDSTPANSEPADSDPADSEAPENKPASGSTPAPESPSRPKPGRKRTRL